MNKNVKKVGLGIEKVFNILKSAPEAFFSEQDLHNEVYRILYNIFKSQMYFNKSIKNRNKLIHS